MTPKELDAALAKIFITQTKPRSSQNSHRRKDWENRRLWKICTASKSCKLGAYKNFFNDGKRHEEFEGFRFGSYYRGIAGVFYSARHLRVVEYSYNKKFVRRWADRRVRHCAGELGDHSFYRKIFDYEWECW